MRSHLFSKRSFCTFGFPLAVPSLSWEWVGFHRVEKEVVLRRDGGDCDEQCSQGQFGLCKVYMTLDDVCQLEYFPKQRAFFAKQIRNKLNCHEKTSNHSLSAEISLTYRSNDASGATPRSADGMVI